MNIQQKQELREAALEYLAERPTMSFSVAAITRGIRRRELVDFKYDDEDTSEAIAVLLGFSFVQVIHSKLGGSREYQATAEGIVYHEQNA